MMMLQFSSGQGPVECQRGVALAVARFTEEAAAVHVATTVLDAQPGEAPSSWRSLLLAAEGPDAETLSRRWCGPVLWVCKSGLRRGVARKNWFLAVDRFEVPRAFPFLPHDIRWETLRASGAGGQHVNRTESAVRATHLPSGISVKVQTERSQHANRRFALGLLAQKIEAQRQEVRDAGKSARRLAHHRLERGNPVRIFYGEDFRPA